MSNISDERSRAGANEQILREQNQYLRGERDRLEEQLAEAVRLLKQLQHPHIPLGTYAFLSQNSEANQ